VTRLFGTDGVRGIANKELTCELALKIGKATALVLQNGVNKRLKFLIGKDTRISSDMLEGALIAGLCSVGADVELLGVIPTPAVAFLVKKYKASAGIMISASHNTYEFNGIKIFNEDGYKLPDILEDKIEELVNLDKINNNILEKDIGRVNYCKSAVKDYINHVKNTVSFRLDGMKIALDCSNGCASFTAEKLFTELGAQCFMLACEPNGVNINENCGSTSLESLINFVVNNNVDVGVAFDGDADRCLAVDELGNKIDGDLIMAICAADMKSQGRLAKNTVVGTVMTNMGFYKFCADNKLEFISTKVGDRYVLEDMLKEKCNLGGEQSGHVIFLDFSTTGDGQLTAAQILSILRRRFAKLSSLSSIMSKYPQKIINIKVSSQGKLRFYMDSEIKKIIEECKNSLGERGRIVARVSGTEPVIRVMVEGEDIAQIDLICERISSIIKSRLDN